MGRGPGRDASSRALTIVDSSVFVDHLRGLVNDQVERFRSMRSAGERVAVTDLIWVEVMSGVKVRSVQEVALGGFEVIETRWPEDHSLAVEIQRRLRALGTTVGGTVDLLVAATAIRSQASLLTRDRDFTAIAQVSDLRLVGIDEPGSSPCD